MAATRQNNTMQEDMAQLMGQLAQMKLTPDADLGFITDMETKLLTKYREPQDQLRAMQQVQQQMAQPQSAGMGMQIGMGSGGPGAGGMPPGAGMPGAGMPPPGMAPPGMPPMMPQAPGQGIPGAGMAMASPANPTLQGVRALQGGIGRITPGPGAVDELRRLLGK